MGPGAGLQPVELMDIYLAENDKRLSVNDCRQLRPSFVPAMVRWLRRVLPRKN